MKKTIIAISLGDPNGIGSEIILKSLIRKDVQNLATYVIFCPWKLWMFYKKHFNINLNVKQINSLSELYSNKINILSTGNEDFFVSFGESSLEAGQLAFNSLLKAAQSVKDGICDVLVTAPINKSNIQSENFTFPGHTEFLESAWGGKNLMFMVHENLKVGLVTQHIPLKDVPHTISEDLIIDKFTLIEESLKKDFNINKPVIGVLGLNPHAGDNGLLGNEEQKIILPAIKKLLERGSLAYGPYPSDSFFTMSNLKKFDAVLCMYHDQGLTPFKTIAGTEGVNYTAGLPFIRTSPDHGVAYDIAGKNVADEVSFVEAIYYADSIYLNRQEVFQLEKNALKPQKRR